MTGTVKMPDLLSMAPPVLRGHEEKVRYSSPPPVYASSRTCRKIFRT